MSARRLESSAFLYAVRPIATDLASTLLFYTVLALTGDPRAAALLGIALGLSQLGYAKLRRLPIAPLQWASVGLIVTLGTLTILTNDPRFVLAKVTIFYAAFGGSMLKPGWMERYIPRIAAGHLPERLVAGFERAWAGLMLFTGVLNLALAFAVDARTTANIMMPWAIGSKVALFSVQYLLFRSIARPHIKAALNQAQE
jgi:intracellular septation protein A